MFSFLALCYCLQEVAFLVAALALTSSLSTALTFALLHRRDTQRTWKELEAWLEEDPTQDAP